MGKRAWLEGPVPAMNGPFAGTHRIALCPETQQLGVLGWDRSIQLFDLNLMIEREHLRQDPSELAWHVAAYHRTHVTRLRGGHQYQPTMIAFNYGGAKLATADMRGILQIWKISHQQEAREYGRRDRTPVDLSAFNFEFGDSAVAIEWELSDIVSVVHLAEGSIFDYREVSGREGFLLSSDGGVVAVKIDARIHVQSTVDQEEFLVIDDIDEGKCKFYFDAKGRRFALISARHVRIWDVADGHQLFDIPLQDNIYNRLQRCVFDPSAARTS